MSVLQRPSFRQLLVVAFLLLTALLAAVSLRGLATLERLLQQGRAGAERSLQLSSQIERLGEHRVTMERASRQFLVLGDQVLRDSYERAATAADAAVQLLASDGSVQGAAELAAAWRSQRKAIDAELRAAATLRENTESSDGRLTLSFRELGALHSRMAERVSSASQAANAALQADLEAGRLALGRQGLAAIVIALVLALALAIWLARPLQRVEAAIVGLGENRLDRRIDIPGPADVRQIGRRLDWLRQRLLELEADKARFLRHVSHELKTPLSALREGVALLDDGVAGPLTDNQREVARILRDNTATLQQRIEDLLRFNAAAFAAQNLVRRPTNMAALVARLADEQQLQWRARGLKLQLPQDVLVAEVDADLLGSALANLLSNAIRYSPAGGTVQVLLRRDGDPKFGGGGGVGKGGDGLIIEVRDQGPGVAAADRDRVFEPFYRGQAQPDDGLAGTGIGLSIVAETAAAHGGRATLLPTDTGAAFCIELPHALVD